MCHYSADGVPARLVHGGRVWSEGGVYNMYNGMS